MSTMVWLAERRVVVAGLVSARDAEPETILDELVATIVALGGVVVGRVLQRRGVSRDARPGGASRMDRPLSAATLLGSGKARELAALCASARADLVVFHNHLTDRQRETLTKLCAVPVHAAAALGI